MSYTWDDCGGPGANEGVMGDLERNSDLVKDLIRTKRGSACCLQDIPRGDNDKF